MADDPIPLPPRPPSGPRSAPRCPMCGRPALRATHPFCSRRCAERDLHRWLAGAYRIESETPPEDPRDPAPSE